MHHVALFGRNHDFPRFGMPHVCLIGQLSPNLNFDTGADIVRPERLEDPDRRMIG
jgi:hypothetical protein